MSLQETKEEKDEPPIHVLEIAGNAIIGGMERYVHNLTKRLPEQGFRVSCLTPYESPFTASLRDLGSEVFVTAMNDDPAWRSIQFTAELVVHRRVDLIHAHLPRAHMLAGLVGRLTQTPVITTVHGMDISGHELGISRTTGTHLTVVCQEAYTQALSLGVPEDRLSLIYNGVDTQIFSPAGSGGRFRKALGIPEGAPLVGFVGRLAWEKGPDQFVRMAEHTHRHRPDVHFVMVGEGPADEEVRAMIESAGLSDILHLTGLIENTWEVYNSLDVMAMTSRVEGMPFALLEAMACGVPVVAMAVGGVAEIVEVSTTGYLSAGGDWAGMGDAVLKLLADHEKKKRMGKAARQRIESRFDLQNSTREMAELFCRKIKEKQFQANYLETSWPIMKGERISGEPQPKPGFQRLK